MYYTLLYCLISTTFYSLRNYTCKQTENEQNQPTLYLRDEQLVMGIGFRMQMIELESDVYGEEYLHFHKESCNKNSWKMIVPGYSTPTKRYLDNKIQNVEKTNINTNTDEIKCERSVDINFVHLPFDIISNILSYLHCDNYDCNRNHANDGNSCHRALKTLNGLLLVSELSNSLMKY